ncbi:bifunctional hydroxymethylpyrimidine kinase/phosphomethylpyrimidine kinase [Silvibacterium acidisoli]|uniref:bifunctional hydroxymethylpyrimidine kinase/phosphomethylpyrimidine kinase n=1 Tax=Acidobacteriaceae bacterium ZG23-2 TaxID=2883246 RepID=UPI00406D2E8F
MKSPIPPVVLTIAGFDPSSGAGITADLKVFAAHKLYGLAAITALTVQSTQGVRRVEPVDPALLAETLSCLADDGPIAGVKVGMLGSAGVVRAVIGFLAGLRLDRNRVVVDPVIRSSSGRALLDPEGIHLLREELLPLTGWVTPNADELALLTGTEVSSQVQAANAGKRLVRAVPGLKVVATGGHLDPPDDLLVTEDVEVQSFPGQRIETSATHGTGCAFSSALLAALVNGAGPAQAVAAAKEYVAAAMKAAYPIGKGRGPLHHFFGFDQ